MELVYLTERVVGCGHPALPSEKIGDLTGLRKLQALARFLKRRHGEGRYMVWNLSELDYDTRLLDDNVLTYKFPGHPSPPLGLLVKLLLSIESWLNSDPRNVAVIHCLTGRGRTGVVASSFLTWTGEAGFNDAMVALNYTASCRNMTIEQLTIPSQRRYMQYFSNMIDGVKPNKPPLTLRRVIMSTVPKFGTDTSADTSEEAEEGCAPYLQVFKSGELIFTTTATPQTSTTTNTPIENNVKNNAGIAKTLPWVYPSDGPTAFPVDLVVQGDILLRCRHLTSLGKRLSMFRAAFHTGYVPAGVLRLSRTQLDGACGDDRFPENFFIDLIFEACGSELAGKHMVPGGQASPAPPQRAADDDDNVVTASTYDSMLHRDDRFWDEIAAKRRRVAQRKEGDDGMSGPTIGRRFDAKAAPKKTNEGAPAPSAASPSDTGDAFAIDPFGIGEEDPAKKKQAAAAPPPSPKKKDTLMEALLALDEDGDDHDEPEEGDSGDDIEGVGVPSPATLPSMEDSVEVVQRDMMGTSLNTDEAAESRTQEATVEGQVGGSSVLVEVNAAEGTQGDKAAEDTDPVQEGTKATDIGAVSLPVSMMEEHAFLDAVDGEDDDLDDDLDDDDDLGDLDDLENFLTRAKETSG
uniref:Phosphatidylinositol-3,4,5-trisphosphate 3-phosphatase n=1 Tax=Corethron hystrix TaxID=216773 RepID=A0A7S1BY77_9STRA|mmetsp:Transcript_43303/g.101541  ORF Transcript_43303/g.101541 Transcript_43303/m.101541 type:complete len:633 (+) Transcript_43303:632-2530(+)